MLKEQHRKNRHFLFSFVVQLYEVTPTSAVASRACAAKLLCLLQNANLINCDEEDREKDYNRA